MEKHYWVAFNMTAGVGPAKFQALLDHFGSLEKAWRAQPAELLAVGLDQRTSASVQKARQSLDLPSIWQRLEKLAVTVLTWQDDGYPKRLKEVYPCPPVLYVRGDISLADDWGVAIVGTRDATHYGKAVARDLANTLVHAGVTVVSGLAQGIDTVAHQAAIEGGGRTIGVLGCGIDIIYPSSNQKLADQMIAGYGAIVSEYGLGVRPDAKNFPPRNRIISGLSLATVVVEADLQSGALITAQFAAEQGREVMAVPGSIYSPRSAGPNRLIYEGARPVLSADDILEELNLRLVTEHQTARQELPTNPEEKLLLDTLSAEPLHVDEISVLTAMPIASVSSTLAMLELKGMVKQVGGMNFVVLKESSQNYRIE
jgi:DNA processing protein